MMNMAKKNTPVISNNACGCLIDDILEKRDDQGDRLCNASESDMEFFVDPDPEKISVDFYQRRLTDGLPIIPPPEKG